MDVTAEVGIVSIFGRGHWLAAELAQAQIPVTLLDVSDQMGPWSAEDTEGPFGFFEMSGLERERLTVDQPVIQAENGLTLWLNSGPVELKGPTTSYRLAQLGLAPAVLEYIQHGPRDAKNSSLKGLSFRETWLAHLAHALSSPIDTLTPEAMREGMRRNLFAPFYVRQATPDGHEKSLRWCEEQGVKVLRQVEIKDLGFLEKQKIGSLEIRQDKPRLFQAEQYVLCLTAEECGMLSHKVQNSLFANRVVEPEWAWLRYRIQMRGTGPLSNLTRDQIPNHCVLIEDLMLPWSHENLLILKRDSQRDYFDAWMKIPNNQRFHSQYLLESAKAMKELLEKKLPDNTVEIIDNPKEAGATFQKLGPARHPVYSRAIQTLRKNHQVGNIAFDSPEYWKSLSWEGQFEHQRKIAASLQLWWTRKEELRLKREAKEAARRKNRGADL